MSDAPKHLYWKGDALLIYTKTHGPEWDPLIKRARDESAYGDTADFYDAMRDLLAYFEEPRDE